MPVIQLELDSKGAVKSLQKFDKAADVTSKKVTANFKKIQIAAAAMAAAATAAVLAIAKSSLDAAAHMQEARNKYAQVFEGMTAESDAWVKNLQNNYGLSEYAATEYLSATKAVLDGTKMQTAEAAKLANKLVLVGNDLASFHDKPVQQAVKAMTSALTGEYEAMKQFGIVIKKTEIIQRAMLDNNLKNKDAVTQAMEAQAAYALIVEKSGKAIGDTIRSQDTYTFQLKQSKALIMNLKVAIGEHLLPYATKILTITNKWIKANQGLIDVKLDKFFENAGQMVQQFAKAVSWAYDRMVAFSNSLALFEAVGSDQLSWFEYATMNAKEAAEWLDKHREVVEKDTDAVSKNAEENAKLKTSLDIVNEAVEKSSKSMDSLADSTETAADKSKDLASSLKDEVTPAVKSSVIPSEKELKEAVEAVSKAAKSSVTELTKQADAANKVAAAARSIQSASRTAEGTYKASKAWSGGTHTFSGSSFESTLSKEELAIYRSMTPAGRGNDFYKTYGNQPQLGPSMGGGNSHDYLDRIQLQHDSARAYIERMRKQGSSAGWSGQNVFNFNQQVSRSDIMNITNSQQTNGARA